MSAVADRCVVAVDGGNTKTLAVVAALDGRVLGASGGGCADIYNAPSPAAALTVIEVAVGAALAQAGLGCESIAAATFSLAGADWPEDFELLERELWQRLDLPVAPVVVHDSLGALRAGSPRWEGIAAVAGTGTAVGARRADGRSFHLGFWPDGAGARDLADAALAAVYRADLGLGPETALTAHALELYGAVDPIALLHEFTRRGGLQVGDQDRLAPVVLHAADAGDAVAREIVLGRGRMLGAQARASAVRAGLPLAGTLVVLAGGVLQHPTELFADAVMAELPGAVPTRFSAPPVVGALMLGFDRLDLPSDADALAASLHSKYARSPAWVRSSSKA